MGGPDLFSKLPEGCTSHMISFTSPRDTCRSSAVCSIFQSASESDSVWERFLPPDYPDVLAGSVSPLVRISSKKELFFRLCSPVLIDDSKMALSSRADGQDPQARGDEWMEIEMGKFFNDEGEEGDLVMIFRDIRDENWNSGMRMGIRLFVEGIEIRPVCE